MQLENINGIGEKKAERLRSEGYDQVEDLAYANLVHYDEIKNASHDLIKEAQKLLDEDPDVGFRFSEPTLPDDAQGHYYCNSCGQCFKEAFQVQGRWHNCDPEAKLRRSDAEGRP